MKIWKMFISTPFNTFAGIANTIVTLIGIFGVFELKGQTEIPLFVTAITVPNQWIINTICLLSAVFFFLIAYRKCGENKEGSDKPPIAVHIHTGEKEAIPSPADTSPNVEIDRLPEPSAALVGREKELEQITDAFLNTNKAVVAIIAGGGVGKSALTAEWLNKMQPDYGGAKRVFAWSFYSQGSHETANSSAPFFQAALPFFGYEGELPKDEIEKARILAKCIQQQDMILILDGMEPLQHPPHILGGEIADTALKEFLRCIRRYGLGNHKSLILISSRQLIEEYEPWKDGYVKMDLNLLNEKQGAELLRSLEVSGTPSDLEAASKEMGGHALGLVLLGKLLTDQFWRRCQTQGLSQPVKIASMS